MYAKRLGKGVRDGNWGAKTNTMFSIIDDMKTAGLLGRRREHWGINMNKI